METLAYLHHSSAFENPEEYEISFDWDQVNLLDSAALSKVSTKGAMYLLAATCGLGVAVASEEAHAVLRPGDTGTSVATLQRALLNKGYSVPGAVSTFYGPSTTTAVRQLQRDCGISVDGIFGPATETCLYGGGGTPPVGGGLLRFGSTGSEVTAWQNALISAGYSVPGAPSTFFGNSTDAATRRLQAACGVTVDGIVGPTTRACLSGTPPVGGGLLRRGSTGSEVTAWQNALIGAGYSVPGAPSTFFGSSTEAATRQLQRDCGVTVDGVVGPTTRACITGGPVGGGVLRPGDQGPAVVALQQELITKAWLSSGLATGFYGPQTTDAIKRLQLSCGIAVDGITGPATRSCLANS